MRKRRSFVDVSINESAAQLSSKLDAELNISLRDEIKDLINRPSDRIRYSTGDLPVLTKTPGSCSSLSSNSTSRRLKTGASPPAIKTLEAARGYEKSTSKVRSRKKLGTSPLLQGRTQLLQHNFATAPPTSLSFRNGSETADSSSKGGTLPPPGSLARKPSLIPEAVKTEASRTPSPQATSKHDRNAVVFWTAHECNLDFNSCKEAAILFTKHRELNDALSCDEFGQLLCALTGSESVKTLPEEMRTSNQAFKVADNNDSGDIDFPEFACYYASKCFSEHINCTNTEREFRELSRKHGLSLIDLERYRRFFDEFDVDGSGTIDEDEFQGLIKKCAKVPKGVSVPETRFRLLWKECDADGSGGIDFEEFVVFYRKYFENDSGISGFEGFYRNIRPVGGRC